MIDGARRSRIPGENERIIAERMIEAVNQRRVGPGESDRRHFDPVAAVRCGRVITA